MIMAPGGARRPTAPALVNATCRGATWLDGIGVEVNWMGKQAHIGIGRPEGDRTLVPEMPPGPTGGWQGTGAFACPQAHDGER
jgi:hypothetical protein